MKGEDRAYSTRSTYIDILDFHVAELVSLFDQLSHRDRAMVLVDVVTGLRQQRIDRTQVAGR
jgi:glycerol-3-phosphate responsive antiterminator